MLNAQVYLASNSSRRRELVAQIGVHFGVIAIDLDEDPLPGEPPEQYVVRVALDKARAGRALVESDHDLPVLAADTAVVVVDGRIFGKPRGSYSEVMGLPLYETARLLAATGIRILARAAGQDEENPR